MSAEKTEFQGKDVADAIRKACKSFKVSQEHLDIQVLSTGSAGIFGLGRQKARLLVSPKKEDTDGAGPAPPPGEKSSGNRKRGSDTAGRKTTRPEAQEKQPAPPRKSPAEPSATTSRKTASPEVIEQIHRDLTTVLTHMGFPSRVVVEEEEESLVARIEGEYVEQVVGPDGKVLDSLQYLLRKMISKKFPDKVVLSLDAGDYRASRLKELEDLGRKLAVEVRETGRTKSIPSLNPSERRIIHLTLQNDKEIRSRSVGEGLFKKVLIYKPGKGRKSGARKKKGRKQEN